MVLESNLQFGSPAGVDSLQVIVGEPRKAGRKRMIVPLEVFVPLDEVTFLPGEQGPVANLELRVAVRDEAGRRSEVPIVPLRLERSEDELSAVVGRFETSLKLRRLSHDAVVAVYDDASGRIFSANIEILPTVN